ncbi:nitrite reductase/ring-hydroxylating ferredoxin subunit [Luteococcus japonicus]|uniref:Cytochrome bc1 complex Rieske iron-sulfur subunit n=2 Tax=Luteococcus japonicus TaxID=33984 RepID=A0A1R4K9Z8_9ACTN|nr:MULTISPECIES: Rieske (2Fe-2S) protein [Luteococcus]MDN5563708.1 Rieske (2Fe-2S) protein [Luteococcus sp.]ROR54451.1 nitrite reductase/ring-hydroxylating ferredoxin subunit [Luteococcus japonicus]SJN40994.1 putative iron sulphur protein (putative secreted protein) [Luteococcus japonicus LSP_Lj1]
MPFEITRRQALGLGGLAAAAIATSGCGSGEPSAQLPASLVPVGGGYIMPDANFVVTQPEPGSYKAFDKHCTHAGCVVSKLEASGIVCICHSSVFSLADGSVQSGPAEKPLAGAKVRVDGDQLRVWQ